MTTAFVFSGQGSQYVGMMKDLYTDYPKAKEIINRADEVLGYKLSEICFEGPLETLKETRYTQPALFVHSAAAFELIKDKIEFDAAAGHSVGEYAALYAAGVLKFEDALKLVSLRGNLMFNAGEHEPGTMFAVIGMDDDKVAEVSKELTDKGNGNVVVAANYNSVGQIVVSGSRDYLRENIGAFKEAGARMAKELVVSGAFHSPLMQPAKEELEKAINDIYFKTAKVPVYANVSALPLKDENEIREALILQLTSPVMWTQSVRKMNEDGVSKFVELGPGNVLQGLVKRTVKGLELGGFDKSADFESIV